MKKTLFVLSVLFLAAAPSWAMTPNYSFVHNTAHTLDSNNNLIVYSKVIAEGYASGCCIPPSTTHQAVAYQEWISGNGTSGGSVYGPRLCWTCNLYAESDGQVNFGPVQFAPLGYDVTEDDEGTVNCSIAGTFWDVFQYFDFEVAYVRTINSGVNQGTVSCFGGDTCNVWKTSAYCTAATTPPDWDPNTYLISVGYAGQPLSVWYIDGVTACVRIKGTGQQGWVCLSDQSGTFFPGSANIHYPSTANLQPANCTHTP